MKAQSVVSMTGFVYDPQEEAYKQMITDLKLRLAPKLSEETEVLIVNDVTTEKYKIARTYEPPIACVTIEWLIDSHRKNKKLAVDKYRVERLFHGAHVKVLDFDQEKSRRLEAKLTEQGAIVKVLRSNAELRNNEERISVLLTTQKNYNTHLRCFMNEIMFPIVGVEWLEDSLRCQLCKFPKDYALNLYYTSTPIDHSEKMRNKLSLQLAREPAFPHDHLFLDGTILYLAENIRPDLARLLKKLVAVLGGYYVDEPSPVVTHILTETVTEAEGAELAVFGALVFLVRVEWLIDSVYLNKRMSEEDYFIRSFKPRVPTTAALEDNTNHMNSTSLNASLPALPRKSISLPTPVPLKVKAKKVISTIFRDCKFYIESTQKKEVEMSELPGKVRNHNGTVFDSRAHIQHGHCYYVLKDSANCSEMIQRLKADTKGHVQVQPVSYRWLNECLSKGQFIDPLRADSYVYKPFNFKTPVMGFHKMVFDLLDIGEVAKLRLKELYNTLGSVRNSPNRAEVTHCLCGEGYRESQRYKDFKREQHSPKFIDWRWLIECVNAARIIQTDKYLLEGEISPENTENASLQGTPELTA